MTILTIRTNKPEAEIGLFDDHKQLVYKKWEAHRQLAETLHTQIVTLSQSVNKELKDIQGIVVFQGPGSFTGLRIGISTANALAYGLGVPIMAAGEKVWTETGIKRLLAGKTDKTVLPEYGNPVHITQQKK